MPTRRSTRAATPPRPGRPPNEALRRQLEALLARDPTLSLRELVSRAGLPPTARAYVSRVLARAGYQSVTRWERAG